MVFDTHWFTTFEHCISAHERRSGRYTSDELPRGMAGMPYDYPGDPELARAVAQVAEETPDTWVHASADDFLAVHYPTINLLRYLASDPAHVISPQARAADQQLLEFSGTETIGPSSTACRPTPGWLPKGSSGTT